MLTQLSMSKKKTGLVSRLAMIKVQDASGPKKNKLSLLSLIEVTLVEC